MTGRLPDARIADDSDSQEAALRLSVKAALRLSVSYVSRPYWRAIPDEERARIVAAVPDGHRLVIKPGYRAKPGTADIELRTGDNRSVVGSRGYVTADACWAVLRAGLTKVAA